MSEDTKPADLEELIPLAQALIAAAQTAPLSQILAILEKGAPAWYQDEDLGWSCLHYAAERREPAVLESLIKGGAVWNAVDKWGRTAGEVCLSLGDREGWEIIRNEGIRSASADKPLFRTARYQAVDQVEVLHHLLSGPGAAVTLRAEDNTSAGDNLTYLQSKLTWDIGDDGRERVLDADGNGVMMGWETPLMAEHVNLLTHTPGSAVLNIGYGLGIVDRLFQEAGAAHHTIIEAHPQVLAYMREKGVDKLPGVRILEGRWQDFFPDRLEEVLGVTEEGGFDAIFMDTFAEGYEELKTFFDIVPDILTPTGAFSFWNGLGATNPTIYAVSSSLAELHMEDVGLNVEWHDVPISDSLREEVWKGVKRKYWELPSYRLPIARFPM